ncbi:MAG: M20/M25/M40 family metallo-hydrolase [Terriglobales bacterium]
MEVTSIAAPTGFEAARAEWMRAQFEALGAAPTIDAAGNVIAEASSIAGGKAPAILVSAHLDTAFPPGTLIRVEQREGRLWGPGICDNGAGLAALLALARIWNESDVCSRAAVIFAATVGEEGEGDLRGMRHLFRPRSRWARRIGWTLVLDGHGATHITSAALPSLRLRVLIEGAGGHSWSDAGQASALHAAVRIGAALLAQVQSEPGELACNLGFLRGGSAVNAIAAQAEMKLDLRARDPLRLRQLEQAVRRALAAGVEQENAAARSGRVQARLESIGARPGGELPPHAPLLAAVREVDAALGIVSHLQCASTDANIPIAQGRQAVRLGAGGAAGGIHTLGEWYNPTGRALALHRIFLLVAALADASFASPLRRPTLRAS